jgi:hypothetical protein
MNQKQLAILADQTLLDVINRITDDQWDKVMPKDFPTSQPDKKQTLLEVIGYHIYDNAWIPDMLAGKTMAEAGKDKYDADLKTDADRAKPRYAETVTAAKAAIEAADDMKQTVHCSFGDFSTFDYLGHVLNFRGLRAHDIAKVIGVSTQLPKELVQGIWDYIEPQAEDLRKIGVFGPKVSVPADATLQDRLLGLTGRQPD